ncbi:GIY-YIG nuclease family protein [Herbaspirillum seropedicae]|uniref:GIY-YIG nuclease family protein n=1 Tax=Herbaspirillum seropedicae TaxID=964 RepID=UPI0011215222|nr:GIY-YIG nuclease family protein [Herbaspirillum seropedicae]QDD66672.1 GIY-YIG nuclease family protein [Herbaspirillum seropedicae]
MTGRSIRIFLADGTTTGTRTAELGLSTIKALAFPRALLSQAFGRPEGQKTGVYILIGEDDAVFGQKRIYIGEGDTVINRISAHNRDADKDFWEEVVLFVSKDENLTKAHVRYVEARLISLAKAAKRSSVANGTEPSEQGKLPEPDQVEMEEFITQSRLLLGALGYDIFETAKIQHRLPEKLPPLSIPSAANELPVTPVDPGEFKFSGPHYDATMRVDLDSGQYIVLAESLARISETASLLPTYRNLRAQLLQNGVLVPSDASSFKFSQDYSFNAPTAAAQVVCASSANGRTAWKLSDGRNFADWQEAELPSTAN